MEFIKRSVFVVVIFLASNLYAADGVTWGGDSFSPVSVLTDSTGLTDLTSSTLMFQLIIDSNRNTSVANMITDQHWYIGAENGGSGASASYNAGDDYVADTGTWEAWGSMSAVSAANLSPTNAPFYVRWFNGTTSASGEAGLIYNTTVGVGEWVTPDAGQPNNTGDFSYGGSGLQGSTGSYGGTAGWATMAAIPEPGTMALFGFGVAAVLARRKRKR